MRRSSFKISFLLLCVIGGLSGCNPLVKEPNIQTNFNPGIFHTKTEPDHLIKVSGDAQWGLISMPLTLSPTVQVLDRTGAPFTEGVILEFQVGANGGSVTHSIVTTDQNGLAATSWSMGPTAGIYALSVTPVEISLPGVPSSVVFFGIGLECNSLDYAFDDYRGVGRCRWSDIFNGNHYAFG